MLSSHLCVRTNAIYMFMRLRCIFLSLAMSLSLSEYNIITTTKKLTHFMYIHFCDDARVCVCVCAFGEFQ